jgi:hypothetical protein
MKRSMKKNIYITAVILTMITAAFLHGCKEEEPTVGTPTVSEFAPSSGGTGGPVGTYVVIKGTFFSVKNENNAVTFNGTPAEVISSTTSEIGVVVPTGATTGKIAVNVKGHSGESATDFTVTPGIPAPAVLSFDPKTGLGVDGAVTVTVSGLNFSPVATSNVVLFNGVAAVPVEGSANGRTVKVVVPAGATTGKLKVTANSLTGTSGSDFAVPAPTVTKFTPSTSIVGSTVVITGTNFSKTAAKNIVKFNGVASTDVSVNKDANELTVVVPLAATTGKISVTVDGQEVQTKDNFVVKL